MVLVEENELGGVCLNAGCIPTKALLKSAETASTIKKSKEFGLQSHWNVAGDRKNRVVKNLNSGLKHLLVSKGVAVLEGRGTIPIKSCLYKQPKKQFG